VTRIRSFEELRPYSTVQMAHAYLYLSTSLTTLRQNRLLWSRYRKQRRTENCSVSRQCRLIILVTEIVAC